MGKGITFATFKLKMSQIGNEIQPEANAKVYHPDYLVLMVFRYLSHLEVYVQFDINQLRVKFTDTIFHKTMFN